MPFQVKDQWIVLSKWMQKYISAEDLAQSVNIPKVALKGVKASFVAERI